jgi:2-oxoglutarate ferredoxin oxidoreductase subunit beta
MHDGSVVILKKLDRDYDPTDRMAAFRVLEESRTNRLLMTGLIYYNPNHPTLQDTQEMVETPLALLPQEMTRPSAASLEEVMASFR